MDTSDADLWVEAIAEDMDVLCMAVDMDMVADMDMAEDIARDMVEATAATMAADTGNQQQSERATHKGGPFCVQKTIKNRRQITNDLQRG
jgi:hypothetical protein